MDKDLNDLRNEIMEITLKIIRLAGKRLELAKKIGKMKVQRNMPIEDSKVEQGLREKVIELSRKLNIDTNFSLSLLDLLIEESKRVQRKIM